MLMGWGMTGRWREWIRRKIRTYSARVDGKCIDVITIRLDHPVHKTILASEDDSQLRPAIDLQVTDLRVIDLFHGPEMHDRRCHSMLF
jgi:hypothetical protein